MASGHYFDPHPDAASRRRTVTLTLPDLTVDLVTDRGVFAGDHVDQGTKYLLLEAPAPPDGGHLLDLGCGYGPIAIALATRAPTATVWAVDVNARARELCAENAERLGLAGIRAVEPDAVTDAIELAAIYSNPPIRIGKPALHDLLITWLDRLADGAAAYLVVQKHLGSDSLARWLTDGGHPVERLGSRAGYRLLEVAAGNTAA
jgi:16S rRNA (guanine1207-N2)-methyltransferase